MDMVNDMDMMPAMVPRTSTGVADCTGQTDAALTTVADYLRECGIRHPDVVRDESHRIVAMARQRLGEHDKESQHIHSQLGPGQALEAVAIDLAIDAVRALHDTLVDHHAGSADGSIEPQQVCIRRLQSLLADPDLVRKPDSVSEDLRNQVNESAAVVIPSVGHRPMRPTTTPELAGPLRIHWWFAIVTRQVRQLILRSAPSSPLRTEDAAIDGQ